MSLFLKRIFGDPAVGWLVMWLITPRPLFLIQEKNCNDLFPSELFQSHSVISWFKTLSKTYARRLFCCKPQCSKLRCYNTSFQKHETKALIKPFILKEGKPDHLWRLRHDLYLNPPYSTTDNLFLLSING